MITDDKLLIEQLMNPKTQRRAFEQVVRLYSEQLYWQVRRIVLAHEDANDVLQNSLIKAWQALDTFKGDSKLITWLSRIAINESLDFLRRQKNALSTDDVDTGIANQLMADEYFDGDETEAMLHEAISRLPDVQRTVFELRYFEDMKYSDTPISASISEDLADLYQEYFNLIHSVQDALTETQHEMLCQCKVNFINYWGQTLCNVLRALNAVYYGI
jgi:RNA polymerase sigma-70 factor (ECF subfamily)